MLFLYRLGNTILLDRASFFENYFFPLILGFAHLFLSILISSFDLILMFLCIIGFSLALYILLFANPLDSLSREAGIKYFYLSALSAGLLGFGIFLTYCLCGSTNFGAIYSC